MDDPIKAMKCLQSASLDEIYKHSFMFDECNILHSGFGEQGIEIRGINLFLYIQILGILILYVLIIISFDFF